MENKYDFGYEITDGSTYSWAINNIAPNSRILELGPSNGKLTFHLKNDLNCSVDIVEINEEAGKLAASFATRSMLGEENGDVEKYIWVNQFKDTKYDYIVLLDVLEHLVDTKKVLNTLKSFLKSDGKILFSVPNVAYNGLILGLCNDHFDYRQLGLLDNTHLRFFTYNSILDLADECGFRAIIGALQLPIYESEFNIEINDAQQQLKNVLDSRKYGNVYQYLVTFSLDIAAPDILPTIDNSIVNNEQISIYYAATSDSFCENQKAVIRYKAYNNAFISASVDFSSMASDAVAFRIDPMDKPGLIGNISIELRDENDEYHNVKIAGSSGLVWNGMICFHNDDPQIYIDNVNYKVKEMKISFSIFHYNDYYFTALFLDLFSRSKLNYENAEVFSGRYTEILNNKFVELDNSIISVENIINASLHNVTDSMENALLKYNAKTTEELINVHSDINDNSNFIGNSIKEIQDTVKILSDQISNMNGIANELADRNDEIAKFKSSIWWKLFNLFRRK